MQRLRPRLRLELARRVFVLVMRGLSLVQIISIVTGRLMLVQGNKEVNSSRTHDDSIELLDTFFMNLY